MDMSGILANVGAFFWGREESDHLSKKEVQQLAMKKARSQSTILVIDDDKTILELVGPLLKDEGFTVMTAQSGPKGLDLLRYAQKDIKVVLLDYSMPRFNGSETLLYVRKLVPNAKVIGLTGIDPQLLPEDYKTNIDQFVPKPFRTADLVDSIQNLIGMGSPALATAKA